MMNQKVIVFGVDGLIPDLIYKFVNEGHLPNISTMMDEGATTELLPYISTWGDVNWVSFLTGQAPGNAWIGQSLPKSNEDNLLGLAETEEKKCALVHFPQSLTTEGTDHFNFAPFYGGKESTPFELATPRVFSTNLDKWPKNQLDESLGWPPSSSIAHHEKNNRSTINDFDGDLEFSIQLKSGEQKNVSIKLVNEQKIELIIDKATKINLQLNEWSNWNSIPISEKIEGTVRFKLIYYDKDNRELDIIQTQVIGPTGLSNNIKLEKHLLNKIGPFLQSWAIKASPEELYYETSFEEAGYQATWLANASIELLNNQNFDLFATVFRLNDETHHTSLGKYDPESPFYNKKEANLYEENMKKSYIVLDNTVGEILREKSDDTTLILASDHGDVPNKYFCDIYLRLSECGLCELDENGQPILEKSKAYLKDERGGLEVFVNLIGRDPQGIVGEKDYACIQDEIFHALSMWVYDLDGDIQQVSALTLRKQDASIIGYWGSAMGDVIFAYNQGFVWGTNKKDVIGKVSVHGANHGPQIPSAKTSHSSNSGIFIISSIFSEKGFKRNTNTVGPYLMSDAGKTIAKLLGIKNTTTLDGRFMKDLFINDQ